MIRYLVDTNVISEPARPNPETVVVERLERHAAELAVSSIVWHEIVIPIAEIRTIRQFDPQAYELFSESIEPEMNGE